MIKAVLFDLDGTLVNSLTDLANSTNYALTECDFATHEAEKYRYFVGDGMAKLIERALPEENRNQEQINNTLGIFMAHYKEHYADKTVLYDGVEELINVLKSLRLKVAVVSNKAHQMTLEVVNKLLKDKFDVVCGKKDGYPTKPDPTLTLEVIKFLGVTPEECVFVGDSGMDMATALNSGALPVGVLWGFRERQELLNSGAKHLIENPMELLDLIKVK